MNKEYDKILVLKGAKAKKPIRNFLAIFFAYFTVIWFRDSSNDIYVIKIDNWSDIFFLIQLIVFTIMVLYVFYEGFIDRILDILDIALDRQVKFIGQIEDYTDFHGYRFDSSMGKGIIIRINGKKRTLYQYYPLSKYFKHTKGEKWESHRYDEVEGIYLKHSKILLEMKLINEPEEIPNKKTKKRR